MHLYGLKSQLQMQAYKKYTQTVLKQRTSYHRHLVHCFTHIKGKIEQLNSKSVLLKQDQ